jgi:hypothetical protein
VYGARLDASGGGRAGTVVVARQAEGPAGIVQRCPGVHAVDGGTQEREDVLYGWQRSRMPSGRPSPRWAVERV